MRIHAVIVHLFVYIGLVHSSHFRGAIIQWRPVDAANFNGDVSVTLCKNVCSLFVKHHKSGI